MAVGDDATSAGYPLVPETGTGGEFKFGWREINRTRDFIAQVKALINPVWPLEKGGTGATTADEVRAVLNISGAITMGTETPTGGNDGDVYFKYLP